MTAEMIFSEIGEILLKIDRYFENLKTCSGGPFCVDTVYIENKKTR